MLIKVYSETVKITSVL